MAKSLDLKEVLLAKMGDIEPLENAQQNIKRAESKVPKNLLFDSEATTFVPELVTSHSSMGLRPLSIQEAKEFDARINECVEELFVEGIDYGTIPGCKSKFLFKAGSEKILNMLGLVARTEIVDKIEDFEVGYFSYTVKSWLVGASGEIRAESYAVCNSREAKYKNASPFNVQNIIIQMARKRSIISCTLSVGTLSNRFSMDMDLVETSQGEGKSPDELKTTSKQRPATKKQLDFLRQLMEQHNNSVEAVNKYCQQNFNVDDFNKLTSAQVSQLIEKYKSLG